MPRPLLHLLFSLLCLAATRADITPLPDPQVTGDPKLPRVLVIGDSIDMNYHEAAKAALKGITNYHRNEGDAVSSAHGVLNTESWLGDCHEKGFHRDAIQFNHGLHDLKQAYDALGGQMTLEVIPGGGHDMKVHWFQSRTLVDFMIQHANPGKPST